MEGRADVARGDVQVTAASTGERHSAVTIGVFDEVPVASISTDPWAFQRGEIMTFTEHRWPSPASISTDRRRLIDCVLVATALLAGPAWGAAVRAAPKTPAQYCAALLPSIQALTKLPLTVLSADDATTDVSHAGEAGYASCVFASGGNRITVILSADPDKRFTDAKGEGYVPLPGYGDVGRAQTKGPLPWVDVMKGSTFCEVLVGVNPKDLSDPEWTHAGGKMCVAAFAAR